MNKDVKVMKDVLHEAEELVENQGEYACEFCHDTGEVSVMEQVYPNEPHMASTGTEVCICRLDLNK